MYYKQLYQRIGREQKWYFIDWIHFEWNSLWNEKKTHKGLVHQINNNSNNNNKNNLLLLLLLLL